MRGLALQPLASGKAMGWRDMVFLQISESHCGRAIRTDNWKYSVRAPEKKGSDPDSDVYVEDYLYDLNADPYEKNNLIAEKAYSDIRVEMSSRLKSCMINVGEKEPLILPAK